MAELVSRVMLDAIEKSIVRQGSFFRDKFFSVVYAIPERVFEYDRITYNHNSLPFAGYEAESTTDAVQGFDTQTARFECIRHKHVITPFELESRLPGRTAYDDEEKIAELQNISYGELERALIRTEEKMAVQALTQGKVDVTLADGSVKNLATYWTTPVTGGADDPLVTAGTAWGASTTGAKMLEDILGWQNLIIQNGGAAPNTLVVAADIGAKLARALMATPTALLNPGNVDAGAEYDREGIQYLGQFAGLSLYASGAALGGSQLLPSGSALLGSSSVAKMMYGPTYLPVGEEGMTRYIGRRSIYSDVKRDPVAIANIIQSAPLPLVRRKWDVLYIKGLSS